MTHPGLPSLIILFCFFQSTLQGQDSILIKPKVKTNMVGVIHDVAFFSNTDATAAHLTSIEYSNKNKVPLILRVNIAHRFGRTGLQLEGDAYPVINKKTYAYLNAGVAADALFPNYRTGVSLFRALPKAFEVEGGFRYLYFKSSVWIYTASIGKYYKRFWFNTSTFLTPGEKYLLQSYFLKTRFYFDEKTYLMLTLGTGISPDDRRNNEQLTGVNRLRATSADMSVKKYSKKRTALSLSAGFIKQEDVENLRSTQINIKVGYHIIF